MIVFPQEIYRLGKEFSMKAMTAREGRYRKAHLMNVRHITLDPRGPGVVRIHMLPPREDAPGAPFLLL